MASSHYNGNFFFLIGTSSIFSFFLSVSICLFVWRQLCLSVAVVRTACPCFSTTNWIGYFPIPLLPYCFNDNHYCMMGSVISVTHRNYIDNLHVPWFQVSCSFSTISNILGFIKFVNWHFFCRVFPFHFSKIYLQRYE